MKIVILDGYALNPGDLSYDCLKAFGELTVYEGTDTEEAAIARIGDAEIVLINKVPITESLLAACPSIRKRNGSVWRTRSARSATAKRQDASSATTSPMRSMHSSTHRAASSFPQTCVPLRSCRRMLP